MGTVKFNKFGVMLMVGVAIKTFDLIKDGDIFCRFVGEVMSSVIVCSLSVDRRRRLVVSALPVVIPYFITLNW